MTAIVKIRSKGTVLSQSLSSVYTAIPGIKSISKAGEKNETWDSSDLSTPLGKTKASTGYNDPPSIDFEIWYDPTHASHIALKTYMRAPNTGTPPNLPCNFKLVYTDTGPLDEIWPVAGIGFDEKFDMKEGVSASVKLECSGDPTS